ncbi:hypothetical protein [Streptosporangium sp. KLBMP 9127]|nr:hypothetical protein [Streptosporangium sp. KLBMP 9127]
MAMMSRRNLLLSAAAVGAAGRLGWSAAAPALAEDGRAIGPLEDGVQLEWLEGGRFLWSVNMG